MYFAVTKLDSSLGRRKYRKEDHFNKTVIQYESKGVRKQIREQIIFSNCFPKSVAHPPPGT